MHFDYDSFVAHNGLIVLNGMVFGAKTNGAKRNGPTPFSPLSSLPITLRAIS